MLIHLHEGVLFRFLHCLGRKIDRRDMVIIHAPIYVRCSIFNDIPPIRAWCGFHLNDGHWLIRTQAWAISAKDWDLAFCQWSIACCVRVKIRVDKCWVSLHSWNASFDSGGTMRRWNEISSDTSKGRLLRLSNKGYFRWNFIIVAVEQIVHFPQQLRKEKKESDE